MWSEPYPRVLRSALIWPPPSSERMCVCVLDWWSVLHTRPLSPPAGAQVGAYLSPRLSAGKWYLIPVRIGRTLISWVSSCPLEYEPRPGFNVTHSLETGVPLYWVSGTAVSLPHCGMHRMHNSLRLYATEDPAADGGVA